jgi:hypothetical protein
MYSFTKYGATIVGEKIDAASPSRINHGITSAVIGYCMMLARLWYSR